MEILTSTVSCTVSHYYIVHQKAEDRKPWGKYFGSKRFFCVILYVIMEILTSTVSCTISHYYIVHQKAEDRKPWGKYLEKIGQIKFDRHILSYTQILHQLK